MKIKNTKPIKFPLSDAYQIVSYVGVVKKGAKETYMESCALYSEKLKREYMFFGIIEPVFPVGELTITDWSLNLEGDFEICLYDRHKEELSYKGYRRYPVFFKKGVCYTLF